MRTRGDWKFVALASLAALLFGLATPVRGASLVVGGHVHDEIANLPNKGVAIARAPYDFQVTLRGHDLTGRITSYRVSDYSTVKTTRSVSLGPCSDCSVTFTFRVDFSSWSCGEHELRFTANVPTNSEGKRQFTTSRQFVTLAGCTTNRHGRSSSWYGGGGGWYSGVEYAIGIQQSPDSTIKPGGVTKWRVQSNAARGCLFLNPDAHNGSMGTLIGSCWTGQSTVTRTIPSSASPGDKLMLYAEDSSKRHAGIFVQKLGAGAARSRVWQERQDWWDKDGLVVP
jgi:hypothetical protein